MGCSQSSTLASRPADVVGDIPDCFLETDIALSLLDPMDHVLRGDLCSGKDTGEGLTLEAVNVENEVSSSSLLEGCYDSKDQTVIVLDWDDTIFPSAACRKLMKEEFRMANMLDFASLTQAQASALKKHFEESDTVGEKLLQSCASVGHVVVVTLACKQWFELSRLKFLPKCSKFLSANKIKVVCAQDMKRTPFSKERHDTDEKYSIQYWGLLKARAIVREMEDFHARYVDRPKMRSWKNILSIGDSDIECYGALLASAWYVENIRKPIIPDEHQEFQQKPFECLQEGELIKVRTKVFKMMEYPSIADLVAQVKMVSAWLPRMVTFDGSFDLRLANLKDASIEKVNRRLNSTDRSPSECSTRATEGDDQSAIERRPSRKSRLRTEQADAELLAKAAAASSIAAAAANHRSTQPAPN